MKTLPWAAVLILLASAEPAWANGAPPHVVWEHDPGYERALLAAVLARLLPVVLLVVVTVWAVRQRRVAPVVCVVLSWMLLLIVVDSAPRSWSTVFLKNGETPPGRTFRRVEELNQPRATSRPLTPEEIFLLGVFVPAVVVWAGVTIARRRAPHDAATSGESSANTGEATP